MAKNWSLEIRDHLEEIKLDITGVVDTKHTWEMKSNLIFPRGHIIRRKERGDKGGESFTIILKENLKFQELLLDNILSDIT